MDHQSFNVITDQVLCHRLCEKLVTSHCQYLRLEEEFYRRQELRRSLHYTLSDSGCRCHCLVPCGWVRIPECHLQTCVLNCFRCQTLNTTYTANSSTCPSSYGSGSIYSDFLDQTLCSLNSSCSSLNEDDLTTFKSEYGSNLGLNIPCDIDSDSRHSKNGTSSGKRKWDDVNSCCGCDTSRRHHGRGRMESCLKRRDRMHHQQHSDDENNINSGNYQHTTTSCGDRLVSPYKRMKVTDKSDKPSEKSVSFAPDVSRPSHLDTPRGQGQGQGQTNAGGHGAVNSLSSGQHASIADSGCFANFGNSGSHGYLPVSNSNADLARSGSQKSLSHSGRADSVPSSGSRTSIAQHVGHSGNGPSSDRENADSQTNIADCAILRNRADQGSQAQISNSGSRGSLTNSGSRGSVANCGSSTNDLARTGSHGNILYPAGGFKANNLVYGSNPDVYGNGWANAGNGGRSLCPEEAYPNVAVTAKSQTKRKVLQTQGQLKVAAYMNTGLLTVHVIQGRQFSSGWKPLCDSFIKISVIPEDRGRKMRLRTKVIADSNNPVFDEKFSLELQHNDESKRLLISVWHKDQNSGLSEFLGCMSFGVKGIAQNTKEVNGWYYLLTEDVGKRKHLVASAKPKAALKMRGNIPTINRDVIGLEPVTVTMWRGSGKGGYGFSVTQDFPVRVGRVDRASPADKGGLKPGDYIIKINNQNVSRSCTDSIVKLVKKSSPSLLLHVQRPKQVMDEEPPVDNTQWKRSEPIYESIMEEGAPRDHTYMDEVDNMYARMGEISVDHDLTAPVTPFPEGEIPSSTPLPSTHVGHRTVGPMDTEQKKQEAIHQLLSLELDFIDFMHAGIQRYSRPLRHCILSAAQHSAVFQNVEKLVTISEYHVKQMQENSPSMCTDSESEDYSQSSDDKSYITSIAMIYHSKVHMFCQAHETYTLGLNEANRVLSELRQNSDFIRFVKEPPLEPGQPSISAFIFRPLQHIKELYQVLQDIYTFTPNTSPDHATLRQVTQVLHESILSISNMSNARVQSLTSLTSHTKTSSASSGKGSSASSSASSTTSSSSKDSCCSGSHRSRQCQQGLPQSASMQTIRSTAINRDLMKLQDRLVFSENVPVCQLCQEDRHIVYEGEVFHFYGRQWGKLTLILLTDMLLLVQADRDGSYHVIADPLLLREICGLEMDRKHATEFMIHTCPTSPCTGIPASQKLLFRTPTPEDKATWKSLLQQRVPCFRGEHEYDDLCATEVSSVII